MTLLHKVHSLPIRARIIASSTVTLVLITLFIAWHYPAQEKERIYATMQSRDHSFAQMLALGSGQGMGVGDFTLVAEALNWAKQDSNLTYITIYDEQGDLFAEYNPDGLVIDTTLISTADGVIEVGQRTIHVVVVPIHHRGEELGTLVLATSLESVDASIRRDLNTTLIISFVLLLLGVGISLVFSRMITKRLVLLTEAAEQVAAGDTEITLDVRTSDEVGVLGAAFNEMVRNIRSAMASIREQEQKYRSIFETAANLIISVDTTGKITDCNIRSQDVLGYLPDDLVGRSMESLMHPDSLQDGRRGMSRVIAHGCEFDIEYQLMRKDGASVDVSINSSAVTDDDGQLVGSLHIIDDITQRKQAAEQEQALAERLERAERMESLGILAGGVAHDLNNMLGPLVAYPEMILESLPADSSVRTSVKIMGKAADRAANVIQDLLTLARRGRYEMEPTDLSEVVTSFLTSAGYVSTRERHPNIKVEMDLDRESKIMGSAVHLEKVIMNLVINAFDAMKDDGTLRISVGRASESQIAEGFDGIVPGDYIVLSVSDTGAGIDPMDIDKIFEPYYSKKKMGRSGSGLGLSVVYGIVKDHKGYYDIFSELGAGTQFVLYFPSTNQERKIQTHDVRSFTGDESILVVDDIQEQRDLTINLLSGLGYQVAVVPGGREAVEYLKENTVDLILLDMIMEDGFDGLDTYRAAIEVHPHQKAIIVSGYSSTERVQLMQELGAGDYVRKPFTRETIGRAVRRELDRPVASVDRRESAVSLATKQVQQI